MPNAITIDNYDVEIHERYATDQQSFDPAAFKDDRLIPTHFEIAARGSSLQSKWEELFETHVHRHAFANFAPPPKYLLMRNRFFSHSISPDFDWVDNADEDADEDEGKKQREEQRQADRYKDKIKAKKESAMPLALMERDKTALVKLFDSIQLLNGFLREVHARKLQYQKG